MHVLGGIELLGCAGCYAATLALEVSRFRFRSAARGALLLAIAWLGFVIHTALLFHRAQAAAGAPLSSQQDWYFVAAWFVVAVYLYLFSYHPRAPFGLLLVPLALGLLGVGRYLASTAPMEAELALRSWGAIHAGAMAAATVAVVVGFMAGSMYLWQVRQLKSKSSPGDGPRLPSLEWLERTNGRALVVSAVMLSVGVAAGVVLAIGQSQSVLPWFDPVVVSTGLMLLWLVAALVASRLTRKTGTGRHVAYLTLASFLVLVAALAIGLTFDSRHGGRGRQPKNATTTVKTGETLRAKGALPSAAAARGADAAGGSR